MKPKFYIFFAAMLLLATLATTCNKPTKVTDVTLSSSQLILYMNKTATLIATVHPIDAANKAVIWTSSNNNVATVENGKITAIKQGTAIITVTTEEGNHKATCTVEVLHPAEPEMVFVEGGMFTMGCTDDQEEYIDWELPQHQVTLSSFKISKYPVTQKQVAALMEGKTSNFRCDDLPADINEVWIPYGHIQEYIMQLNKITGKNYRLPTEAEWEYAARGGNKSKGYKYSGSNDIDEVAWYWGNSDEKVHPVGRKKPNELGIYDMSGNVWELCKDWFELYDDKPQTNPQGPDTGRCVVVRGGFWLGEAHFCRVSTRGQLCGKNQFMIGFRLVLP